MKKQKYYYVYIVASESKVLYIGVTNDISRRTLEHKLKLISGFTQWYAVSKLVYYETFSTPLEAIVREKQLKRWRRSKKLFLIEKTNGDWRDLAYFPQSDFEQYKEDMAGN